MQKLTYNDFEAAGDALQAMLGDYRITISNDSHSENPDDAFDGNGKLFTYNGSCYGFGSANLRQDAINAVLGEWAELIDDGKQRYFAPIRKYIKAQVKEQGWDLQGDKIADAPARLFLEHGLSDCLDADEAIEFLGIIDKCIPILTGTSCGNSQSDYAHYVRILTLDSIRTSHLGKDASLADCLSHIKANKKLHNSNLQAEQKTWDAWAWGEVYGFTIEAVQNCTCCKTERTDSEDSCFGFYGLDSVIDGVNEAIANIQ